MAWPRALLVTLVTLVLLTPACGDTTGKADTAGDEEETDYRIFFQRRTFLPPADIDTFLDADRRYGLLQLHEFPKTLIPLTSLGIEVHGVQHNKSYYVTVPDGLTREHLQSIDARALFAMEPLDRISPRLVPRGVTEPPDTGEIDVTLHFVESTPVDLITTALRASGATPLDLDPLRGRATIRLPSTSLLMLAHEPWLWWVDMSPGPVVPDLDVVTERIGAVEVQPPPWGDALPAEGLTGIGIAVGLWEVAVGQSAAGVLDSHPDLAGRITFGPDQMSMPSAHATNVAGVLAGDGTASTLAGGEPLAWAGIAPETQVVSWDAVDSSAEMVESLALFDTTITSHSFGLIIDSEAECGGAGAYDVLDADYDDVVWSASITAFVSPGNNAELTSIFNCAIDVWDDGILSPLPPEVVDVGFGSVTALGVAKNPVAVGGRRKSTVPPGAAAYSGRGPTADGRLKPDVVAISGDEDALLTMPSSPELYTEDLGVSFAVPQAAGAAALLLEHYRQGTPALVQQPAVYKAVLANTAADVGPSGPDYVNGYGLIQIPQALAAADSFIVVPIAQDDVELISPGIDLSQACGLRIMAVWSDPPSMAPATTHLVNDIDLSVFSGEQEFFPWVLTPSNPLNLASRGVDSVNNVEQVTIEQPTGDELIRLMGTSVPMGPQDVVLHWYAVPCDLEAADVTGAGEGDGGESGGCSCATDQSPYLSLPCLLMLGALALRGRSRSVDL